MAILGDSPLCTAAFLNLHSPVVAVGRKCEHISECGREHHAGEHANQIYVHHLSFPHSSLYLSFVTRRQAGSVTRRDCAGRTLHGLIADDAKRISLSSNNDECTRMDIHVYRKREENHG